MRMRSRGRSIALELAKPCRLLQSWTEHVQEFAVWRLQRTFTWCVCHAFGVRAIPQYRSRCVCLCVHCRSALLFAHRNRFTCP